ncbi:MAG: O-antigen ligase family protein [Candidatus Gastranaerophilaceae bacterium]
MKKINLKLDLDNIFWCCYFLMIALPLHASNKLLSYLSITGMISIFHIILIIMLVWLTLLKLKKGDLTIQKKNIPMLILAVLLLFSVIIGLKDKSHIFNNVIGDCIMYFMSFAILWIVRSKQINAKDIRHFFYLTFNAMTMNLIINVIMYLTQSFSFWGVQFYNGGRFGGGYLSLLVVTIIYGVYDYLYEKNISTWHLIVHVALAIFSSMLAQSRTHVILCFIGCLILFIPIDRKLSKIFLLRVFVLVIIGGIGVYAILNGNSELAQRLINMDITSNTETTASRVFTWKYYWNLICQTPYGKGFGEIMYFINPTMTIAKDTATYYIDNAVAIVLYKCGWLCGILYLFFIISTLKRFFKCWKFTKDKIYLLFIVIFSMLIISTMILTSQVIHTYAVNTFIWTTVALSYCWKEKLESNRKIFDK